MPIYSHECECGDCVVDNLYRSSDKCPKTYKATCCACDKKDVTFSKIITAPSGFRMKGAGVYKPTSSFD